MIRWLRTLGWLTLAGGLFLAALSFLDGAPLIAVASAAGSGILGATLLLAAAAGLDCLTRIAVATERAVAPPDQCTSHTPMPPLAQLWRQAPGAREDAERESDPRAR